MTNAPKVSVIMPAHNQEKFISEAIESVLAQSFRDFELIIVDDGSADGTGKIAQNYAKTDPRVKYVRNEFNLKICMTLNKAVDLAKGEYIARMDADDWMYPQRLEEQVLYLDSNPETVIVGGSIELCDENMKVINVRHYELDDKKIRQRILRYSPFAHPAVMYTADAVRKAGKYDERLIDVEDYDLYFRLGKLGKFGNLADVLLKLRTHKESVSQRKIDRQAWVTLGIKFRAIFTYGYRPGIMDMVYLLAHLFGNIFIPGKLKFKLFNAYRTVIK